MTQLENELRKRKVADAAGIIDEYGQHFAFKMADGYSEEEIAARLGDPTALAARFGETGTAAKKDRRQAACRCRARPCGDSCDIVSHPAYCMGRCDGRCLRFLGGACRVPYRAHKCRRCDTAAAVLARGNLGAVVCAAERAHRSRLRVLLGIRAPARALVRQVQAQCACLGNG